MLQKVQWSANIFCSSLYFRVMKMESSNGDIKRPILHATKGFCSLTLSTSAGSVSQRGNRTKESQNSGANRSRSKREGGSGGGGGCGWRFRVRDFRIVEEDGRLNRRRGTSTVVDNGEQSHIYPW